MPIISVLALYLIEGEGTSATVFPSRDMSRAVSLVPSLFNFILSFGFGFGGFFLEKKSTTRDQLSGLSNQTIPLRACIWKEYAGMSLRYDWPPVARERRADHSQASSSESDHRYHHPPCKCPFCVTADHCAENRTTYWFRVIQSHANMKAKN